MSTHATLETLLARGRPILLDGATGTELARRGVSTTLPLWSAHALADERGLKVLRAIHEDYARAGAEILVTNTFRTTPRALGRAGAQQEWRLFNRRAVECARAAAAAATDHPCLVAGGLAPLEDCYRPDLVPSRQACLEEHRLQAGMLAELGVDLLFIETMNSRREAGAALEAALATGLDLLLSLCPEGAVPGPVRGPGGPAPDRRPGADRLRPGEARLLSGEPLQEVVPALFAAGGARLKALLLNCAPPEVLQGIYPAFAALAGARSHGLYAHLGEPDEVTGWRLPREHDPDGYAAWMARRLDEGARLAGGCCGTTPEHIAALARLIARRP